MIRPPKKPGRPSLGPIVSVTVRLPAKHYDQLYKQAAAARCSIAEHVRRVLTRRVISES